MTEAEWLGSTDPQPLLTFLGKRASDRQLRLFATACSRRIWPRLADVARAAVQIAEAFADRLADADALRAARLACRSAGANAAWYAAATSATVAARNAALSASSGADDSAEQAAQAALVREIAGNPFRPVVFAPAWLTADVRHLAQVIYDDRAFDRLPALADALAAGGCDNDDLLGHCRTDGPHVRGCWALDLVLGKN